MVILEGGDGNFLFLKLGDRSVYFIMVYNIYIHLFSTKSSQG